MHATQRRKSTPIPYLSHLLAVSSLVWEAGGDEDQAIAALLHDAVEDQGGRATLEAIRLRFGERVASIVEVCTDADVMPKPPWRVRKEAHLAHVAATEVDEALVVVAADKLHNARCILADVERDGASVWARFNGGRAGTAWYYRAMREMLERRIPDCPLMEQLRRVSGELERLAGSE